ncbi:hypothetical protein Gotri_014017, partial [Gossypium trilobum]|nr:hypothetical protein [Gossypium trilobum]
MRDVSCCNDYILIAAAAAPHLSESCKERDGNSTFQCLGCEKPVEGWSYGCSQCEFYLRKGCAELELAPQIQHPFHPKHPLTLLPKSPYPSVCDLCGKEFEGFVYNCYDYCTYTFNLHKECAELELAPQIQHPLRPKHTLTLFPESPYGGANCCNLCGKKFQGFAYNCGACQFDLDINCALLQSSIAANFPNSLHPHPLFFIQNHNREVELDCSWCQKPISGPFYHCSDCTYPFKLHKECAELPLEIQHPFHPKHPLTLFPESLYPWDKN